MYDLNEMVSQPRETDWKAHRIQVVYAAGSAWNVPTESRCRPSKCIETDHRYVSYEPKSSCVAHIAGGTCHDSSLTCWWDTEKTRRWYIFWTH